MSRVHKILWLILIIIAIGIVAVATRTPHRRSERTTEPAVQPGPSDQPAGPRAS